VFQPNGLVVFMKRWLPDWEEPLHLLRRKDRAAVLSASLASAASGERLPAEQA
jgi:hypothetical protein